MAVERNLGISPIRIGLNVKARGIYLLTYIHECINTYLHNYSLTYLLSHLLTQLLAQLLA